MSTDMHPRTEGRETVGARASTGRAGPVIALLAASAFVVMLNETVMGVALPALMVELNVTASTGQWLTTAFLLTMAVVIPATGFLLQRFSIRSLFFSAMALFTIGTIAAAAAPGFAVLVAARIVQASGTAIMMPLLFTTVLNLVPVERRGRMMGVISIVISVAPAVGPTISGLILASLHWRWLFVIMVPIAVAAIILGAIWVRNVGETKEVRLDALSLGLSAVGFGGLIFGLSSIGEAAEGHALIPIWIPLVLGGVALVAFVARQLRLRGGDRVLLDVTVFRYRQFTVAVILVVVSMATLFGTLILLPLYLQQVRGFDTLATGLMLLPGGLLMGVLAPLVGNLFDRVGARPLVLPGAVLASAGMWVLFTVGAGTPVWIVVSAHTLLSCGLAFVFTPLLTSALGGLPRRLYSFGSATVSTLQQVAAAAGTALFVTIMTVGGASAVGTAAEQAGAGIHTAFLVGAVLSLLVIVIAGFVRNAPVAGDHMRVH